MNQQVRCVSKNRVVAITGATGFVGRRLVERHLVLGDKVRVLSRKAVSLSGFQESVNAYRGDLNGDPGVLREFVDGADVLYHCAAELRDTRKMNLVNVVGTRNLAEAASNRIRHWVQLSSVAVYGRLPPGRVTESTLPNDGSPYPTTQTKLEAEKIVREQAARGGFSFSILRPCKIYGADMPDDSLRNLAGYIERGFFFFIGERGASANYVHVDNVVEALMLCATHEAARNQIFNLSDGFTIEEMITAIAGCLGCPMPWMRIPEGMARGIAKLAGGLVSDFPLNEERISGLTSRVVYATDAITRQLGYRSVVSMEQGIENLLGSSRKAGVH